jgi:hypothetical protein
VRLPRRLGSKAGKANQQGPRPVGSERLEGLLAITNTVGVVHASPEWASPEFGLVVASGTALRTPFGHTWIFGGSYIEGLGDALVATSPVFGWRTAPEVREAIAIQDRLTTRVFPSSGCHSLG